MKPILCLLGIHQHEPIKRIRRIATICQSGRMKDYWRGYNIYSCTRCGHKLREIEALTDPMTKIKADRWLKLQKGVRKQQEKI